MKKTLTLCFFMAILFSVNAQNKTKTKAELFGEWKFIQSDKAMQYRFRKEKQEGDVIYLKMQFRLNKTDEIFCNTPECKGYLWFFNFESDSVKIDNHYMVYNSFERIKDFPQTIILKLMKSEYGEQYWDETEKAIFFKDATSGESTKIVIGWSCVDNILDNNSSNRCSYFKMDKSEVLK
jgi:hypothetical protein